MSKFNSLVKKGEEINKDDHLEEDRPQVKDVDKFKRDDKNTTENKEELQAKKESTGLDQSKPNANTPPPDEEVQKNQEKEKSIDTKEIHPPEKDFFSKDSEFFLSPVINEQKTDKPTSFDLTGKNYL